MFKRVIRTIAKLFKRTKRTSNVASSSGSKSVDAKSASEMQQAVIDNSS